MAKVRLTISIETTADVEISDEKVDDFIDSLPVMEGDLPPIVAAQINWNSILDQATVEIEDADVLKGS